MTATDERIDWRGTLGRAGEDCASRVVQECGYEVLARNWRNGTRGEIDLIARSSTRMTTFIEVKTRIGDRFGSGLEAVTHVKFTRIAQAAAAWCAANRPEAPIRFHVVSIEVSPSQAACLSRALESGHGAQWLRRNADITWCQGIQL